MIVTIHPSGVTGKILSPRSKSSMQRACAAALLRKGITEIHKPGNSNDDLAALDVISKLGAVTETQGNMIRIQSQGVQPVSSQVHCGESGLGIRMFTPIAALSSRALEITGTGSLVTRPMHFFDEIFPQLGIQIKSNDGKLPLLVQGPLRPADITVDGSLSSQFLTGLLMAYSAAGASGVEIRVNGLKSKPYIDLTLSVMRSFGMPVPEVINYERFIFHARKKDAERDILKYSVEGDWSGAAFLIVAGAISGDISITGLQPDSVQADKAILQALEAAGGKFVFEEDELHVFRSPLKAFTFDATECPDLFPPLAVLASYATGRTLIKGATRLAHKESNRALTLQEEFGKLGIQITLAGDEMYIHGSTPLSGGHTRSHHDHRIAMAMAIAALGATGPVTVADAEAINKSYPAFYSDLQLLGAKVDQHN
jgi:3-phosphoshikimate 1-carboxyvinyltransferase